ncbi:MAG: hypothetical protein WCV86_03925 [Patescibacteria group bacterium]|jgi:hypothetical protein
MDDFRAGPGSPQMEPFGHRRNSFFSQKNVLIIISCIVAVGLIVGFMQIRGGILSAFNQNTLNQNSETQDEYTERLLALAEKDTDQDGISDFKELYQLGTSPYLFDSDSDGLSDLSEIENNTNPNCPEGQDCTGFISPEELASTTTAEANTNSASAETNLTAEAIRETLRSSGSPEYLLDATSDEELLSIYTEVTGGEAATTSDGADTLATLQAFTPDDIRDFLVSTGADASVLSEVSDADLNEIFRQALEEEAGLFADTADSAVTNTNSSP